MRSIHTRYRKGSMQADQPIEVQPKSSLNPTYLVVGAGVAVALGALAYTTLGKKMTPEEPMSQTVPVTSSPTTTTLNTYKDGTYTVNGKYTSPGGDEEIGVTVTLKDGVITDTTVEPKTARPISQKFQGIFNENYKPFVMGKKINEVNLDKVSGSSLTPKGFMQGLEQIKQQAGV